MDEPGANTHRFPDHPPAPEGAGDAASDAGRRQSVVDRRTSPNRRAPLVGTTGLERRRGPGRRLSDFTRSAEEGEMTTEQFLFLMAIDGFKKANGKAYPSWTDVLEVVRLLGYRKTMPSELKLSRAEDWREAPDSPSNVRTERQKERSRLAADPDDPRPLRDAA